MNNLMENRWTKDEIELVYTDMTNEEIAKQIGRSVGAVREKRYRMTGHKVPPCQVVEKETPKMANGNKDKEWRLIALAKKLGVKLFGK